MATTKPLRHDAVTSRTWRNCKSATPHGPETRRSASLHDIGIADQAGMSNVMIFSAYPRAMLAILRASTVPSSKFHRHQRLILRVPSSKIDPLFLHSESVNAATRAVIGAILLLFLFL